jgi:hypothetical protein
MIRPLIRTGYDFSHAYLFEVNGDPEDMAGATISISLKNSSGTEIIADTAQTDSGAASWADGLVYLRFTKIQTAGLTAGDGFIEVSITKDGEKIPYRDIAVDIETGVNAS